MRVLLPQFVFKDIARAILFTSVAGLWVFSGVNLYFDLRKSGSGNSNYDGQVLSQQSFASVFPNVLPSIEPTESPKVEAASSFPVVSPTSETNQKVENAADVSSQGVNKLTGEVNSFREKNGKGSIIETSAVCDFVKERLTELQSNYSHDGFSEMKEKTGKGTAAENIARTSTNKGAHFVVFEMWAKSEGHRNNMLGDYPEGCGCYDGKYAVLILAK